MRIAQVAIIAELVQQGPIEIERLDGAALRLEDGGVRLGGGARRRIAAAHLCFGDVPFGTRSSYVHDVDPSICFRQRMGPTPFKSGRHAFLFTGRALPGAGSKSSVTCLEGEGLRRSAP
jgi:hypothetical protein